MGGGQARVSPVKSLSEVEGRPGGLRGSDLKKTPDQLINDLRNENWGLKQQNDDQMRLAKALEEKVDNIASSLKEEKDYYKGEYERLLPLLGGGGLPGNLNPESVVKPHDIKAVPRGQPGRSNNQTPSRTNTPGSVMNPYHPVTNSHTETGPESGAFGTNHYSKPNSSYPTIQHGAQTMGPTTGRDTSRLKMVPLLPDSNIKNSPNQSPSPSPSPDRNTANKSLPDNDQVIYQNQTSPSDKHTQYPYTPVAGHPRNPDNFMNWDDELGLKDPKGNKLLYPVTASPSGKKPDLDGRSTSEQRRADRDADAEIDR